MIAAPIDRSDDRYVPIDLDVHIRIPVGWAGLIASGAAPEPGRRGGHRDVDVFASELAAAVGDQVIGLLHGSLWATNAAVPSDLTWIAEHLAVDVQVRSVGTPEIDDLNPLSYTQPPPDERLTP